MKRQQYALAMAIAGRCDKDAPRTPYAAEKEARGMGVQLVTRGDRQHIVRTIEGEGLAILTNARSWPGSHDGRALEVSPERRRDAEFARIVSRAQP